MNNMKVAVVNFSGNVGKSTMSRHLLSPRMNNAQIFSVESINSDGTQTESSRGRDIVKVQMEMMLADDAIVDIGSSNIEDVIAIWKQNPGMHEDFDYFVVPVEPGVKQQTDTISTIDELAGLGVPAKKIRLLMNKVDMKEKPDAVFSALVEYQKEEKKFTLKMDAVIYHNPLFLSLAGASASIADILADQTDYKELNKTITDREEKVRNLQMLSLQRGAAGVVNELDAVFKALFK